MRCLPLVLLALALPALGDEPDDAGIVETNIGRPLPDSEPASDGGFVEPADDAGYVTETPVAANHHFSLIVDSEPVTKGRTDAQLWLTPHWGRVESYTAADLRAGMTQGLTRHFTLGLFVDATPSATGETNTPAVDARFTAMGHVGVKIGGVLGLGGEVVLSGGLDAFSFAATAIADAQIGNVRFGLNVDVWRDARWHDDGSANLRFRQTFGAGYSIGNGVSLSIEFQNRLSWRDSDYRGLAFYVGPSLGYRGRYFWVTAALLPQVAAQKIASQIGGDPLELIDNERFVLRLSLGLLAP